MEKYKKYNGRQPKQLAKMMRKYGEYINLFYSKEIEEYSSCAIRVYYNEIPEAVLNKLRENNIIYIASCSYSEFCLTEQARKKLTRRRKMIMGIDKIITPKSKQEE